MLVRCMLIVLSITPTYLFADESSSSNPVEDLIRLKQKLILEHMAGDGETKLQRAIREDLNKKEPRAIDNKNQSISSENSLTKEMIQDFELQYKPPENCSNWRNDAHMVNCINHKMRSREEFFENKDILSNSRALD